MECIGRRLREKIYQISGNYGRRGTYGICSKKHLFQSFIDILYIAHRQFLSERFCMQRYSFRTVSYTHLHVMRDTLYRQMVYWIREYRTWIEVVDDNFYKEYALSRNGYINYIVSLGMLPSLMQRL